MDQPYYATEYGMDYRGLVGYSQQGVTGAPSYDTGYHAQYEPPSHGHHGGYDHAQHTVPQSNHYSYGMHPSQQQAYGHPGRPVAAAGPYLQTQDTNAGYARAEDGLMPADDQLRAVRDLPERFQPLFTQFRSAYRTMLLISSAQLVMIP